MEFPSSEKEFLYNLRKSNLLDHAPKMEPNLGIQKNNNNNLGIQKNDHA